MTLYDSIVWQQIDAVKTKSAPIVLLNGETFDPVNNDAHKEMRDKERARIDRTASDITLFALNDSNDASVDHGYLQDIEYIARSITGKYVTDLLNRPITKCGDEYDDMVLSCDELTYRVRESIYAQEKKYPIDDLITMYKMYNGIANDREVSAHIERSGNILFVKWLGIEPRLMYMGI
jgi:hypothetical protein